MRFLCLKQHSINKEKIFLDFSKVSYLSRDLEIAMEEISEKILENIYFKSKEFNFDIEYLNNNYKNIFLGLCFMAENVLQHDYSKEYLGFIWHALEFNEQGVNIYFWGRGDHQLPDILVEHSPMRANCPPWVERIVPADLRNKDNSKKGEGISNIFHCFNKLEKNVELSWYPGVNHLGEQGNISKIFIELIKKM